MINKKSIIQRLVAVSVLLILLSLDSTSTSAMTIIKDTRIILKYLNILPYGGRGGVTRFFLLSQGISFDEDLVANWAQEKERLVESGENPSGSVPILYSTNGDAHPQHIAAARYMARVYGLTSGDDYEDYVQDLVSDEYQGFRDQWASATFRGNDEAKKVYKDNVVPVHLKKFNALYESFKTHDIFLSVSFKTDQPLWGDAAIYGLLRDHIVSGYLTREDLTVYPQLMAMFTAYEDIPAIKTWLESLEKK